MSAAKQTPSVIVDAPQHGEVLAKKFARAKGDPSWPEYDPADDDTFWMGIVSAEFAAHYDEINCAGCGSADIVRMPMSNPGAFATVTTKDGKLYGYALCPVCRAELKSPDSNVVARVDAALDGAVS